MSKHNEAIDLTAPDTLERLIRMAAETGAAGFPSIEKHGFVPFEKGDFVYAAEIHEAPTRVIVDIRREEVVGTWNTRQTRHFFLGELTTIGADGGEYRTPIRNAYHSLGSLLESLSHMVSNKALSYIQYAISTHPTFKKIGTFRLLVELDPRTGESRMEGRG